MLSQLVTVQSGFFLLRRDYSALLDRKRRAILNKPILPANRNVTVGRARVAVRRSRQQEVSQVSPVRYAALHAGDFMVTSRAVQHAIVVARR